ncbi:MULTISPECIES: septal ring lytic transglycosylase RlpA family protein [unclassified Prochlorococcus]|uniref:septal ring lytic transglycosylase RlpA family protein n=1 Tax=unclassified Prochlorococcus TaxID=2627481 RepID=UPI0005336E40|nr:MULTISPECIES: septal ring lytic transglycosylase RlpA family protein [unclassified Prochlorococcus]KGG28811.1 putative rare lipoprotein A precursor [Prochlorococcus sp. MIT 0701]KGG29722.1 putative rare lipoprotein A precursor [Prochlorococcus sp. MIT 0702]KGG34277.1 putative rare lipoprotein A precursor [Prochlorococcus sp. MIT 0703]
MRFSVSLLVLAGVCSSSAALLPAFALDLDLDKKVTREQVKTALLERISLLATPFSANQGSSDQGSSDQGSSDQGSSDQGSSDQGSSDQGSSDQGSADVVTGLTVDSVVETPPELPIVPVAKLNRSVKPTPTVVQVSTGEASWYGPGFFGNRTASGEVFRPGTMTAAHRSLPFGTKVRVTNLWNDRSAVVTINDRGPFIAHRVIDLAHGAAHELGLVSSGIAQVRLEVLR